MVAAVVMARVPDMEVGVDLVVVDTVAAVMVKSSYLPTHPFMLHENYRGFQSHKTAEAMTTCSCT